MDRIDYPDAAEHRNQHQQFIKRLEHVAEEYRMGAPVRGIDVIGLLGSWWQNHIKGSDGKVAQFAAARKAAPQSTPKSAAHGKSQALPRQAA
jgi:methyl-accepting chemotaxis protein